MGYEAWVATEVEGHFTKQTLDRDPLGPETHARPSEETVDRRGWPFHQRSDNPACR